MKKTTKPLKTPAPATKLTAPAPALAPARKSTVEPKIKAPAPASTPPPAVVAKPKGGRVTIVAKVDVGFGNSLYVRGDEPYLHWAKGTALGNIAGDRWEIVLSGVEKPFEFKFLVNDTSWSTGENYCVAPGDTVSLTPSF
jgi:hypothetical protein